MYIERERKRGSDRGRESEEESHMYVARYQKKRGHWMQAVFRV